MKSDKITLGVPHALKVGPDTVKAVPVERAEGAKTNPYHIPWPRYKVVVAADNNYEAAARVEGKIAKRGGYVTPGMFLETWYERIERQTAVAQVKRAFAGITNKDGDEVAPLFAAVARFRYPGTLGVDYTTLRQIAARICELSDIVEQNALTADDLPVD